MRNVNMSHTRILAALRDGGGVWSRMWSSDGYVARTTVIRTAISRLVRGAERDCRRPVKREGLNEELSEASACAP